jgi:spore germination protein KC
MSSRSSLAVPAAVLAVALVLGGIGLPGCWDRRETETLAFVTAMGVDRDPLSGLIQITAMIARPFTLASGGAQGAGAGVSRTSWLVTASGRTSTEAARGLARQSPRQLYWSHCRWVAFGEEACREGLLRYLDFFVRDPETRRRVTLLAIKGESANSFLQAEFELARLSSEGLLQTIEAQRSTIIRSELHDFLVALEEEGSDPAVTRVETIPKAGGAPGPGQVTLPVIKTSPVAQGAAAFKGDRLAGWLDETEARGYNWIRSRVESGNIVVKPPDPRLGLIGLEIIGSRGEITPKLENGRLRIEIKVRAHANIADVQWDFDPVANPEIIKTLQDLMAEAIRNEILQVVTKAQKDFKADIFGFGAAIHRSYPRQWRNLRDRWDEEFPQLEVVVEVKAMIEHTAKTLRGSTRR